MAPLTQGQWWPISLPSLCLAPIPFNEAALRVAGHHLRRHVPPVPGSSGCRPDSKYPGVEWPKNAQAFRPRHPGLAVQRKPRWSNRTMPLGLGRFDAEPCLKPKHQHRQPAFRKVLRTDTHQRASLNGIGAKREENESSAGGSRRSHSSREWRLS